MGENLSEINRGPRLKKQRWWVGEGGGGEGEKKGIIEIPHRGHLVSSLFFPGNFFIQELFKRLRWPRRRGSVVVQR